MPLVNGTVVLKFKDELQGRIMKEYVGLRPKLYSFRTEDEQETKKSRGIKMNVVNTKITFHDYLMSLVQQKIFKYTQCTIQSKLHNVFTIERSKIGLNYQYNKGIIMQNHMILPYGHYLLEK